jgi:hypothetical protein
MPAGEVLMAPDARRLPPRRSLPRDVVIPVLPGLGLSWYDRGRRYWMRRAGMSLMWAVVLAVIVLFDAGLFSAIRHTSVIGFYAGLGVDVAVTLAVLVYFAVRTARRWNVAAPPRGMSPVVFRFGKGRTGNAVSSLAQLGYTVLQWVLAVLLAIFPGLIIGMFLSSLLPETLIERQARLWLVQELRSRGHLDGAAERNRA